MTLAELLVVLLVLAITATIAVQSLAPRVEQSRFEATQQTLENIRTAIVEVDSSSAGSTSVAGFVADTGRLPVDLAELIVQPADLPTFSSHTAPAPNSDVSVPSGWRGPYLRLPVGATTLLDGWGLTLGYLVDATPVTGGVRVTSVAANRPTTTPGYNTDLSVTLKATDYRSALLTGKIYKTDPDGGQLPPTGTGWTVTLLGAGPAATNGGVAVESVTASNTAACTTGLCTTASATTADNGELTYKFSDVTVGPRILRMLHNGVAVGPPIYVTIKPGATQIVDLLVVE